MAVLINQMLASNTPFTQEEFLKLKKFDSVAEDVTFKSLGNATYSFILAQIKDGKVVPIEE
ncbi:MAG: hypothetical protein E7004_03890 [Alphaproteobacteria bacterium]|nr:hypothetical protein [Alphaproteobacteria bacterium]